MGESGLSNKAKAVRVAAGSGAVLSLGASLIATAGPAGAATFNVTTTADAGVGSLRQAIADANAAAGADTITFQPGLGTVVLTTGDIDVLDDLSIIDPEADVAITTNGAGRAFYLQAAGTVTLSGLDLSDNDILGNGGAVLSVDTDLTIVDSTFSGNQVAIDGAAVSAEDGGSLTITDSTFTGNHAYQNGGAVNAYSIDSLAITGSTFTDNDSGSDGGAVQADNVTAVTVTDTTFTDNFADSDGGGLSVYAQGGTDSVTLTGVTATGNLSEDQGGGVVVQDMDAGSVNITGSTFADNEAMLGGGVTLTRLENGATVAIGSSTFVDNVAEQYVGEGTFGGVGGGLYLGGLSDGGVVITTSTFDSNQAVYGGGIAADDAGTVTITESTISNNTADTGGGILAEDTILSIVNSTISGNTAEENGGGLSVYGLYGEDVSVTHSTITGNTAAYGGGAFFGGYGTVTLEHDLIDGNIATGSPNPQAAEPTFDYQGSALFFFVGKRAGRVSPEAIESATLRNSLVNGTIAGEAVDGGGNLFDLPANLGPLADNGGPTFTHNLLTGSAALDAGDAAFTGNPTNDQRGLPRVSNARIDIGAVEVQVQEPVEPPVVPPAQPVPADPTFTG